MTKQATAAVTAIFFNFVARCALSFRFNCSSGFFDFSRSEEKTVSEGWIWVGRRSVENGRTLAIPVHEMQFRIHIGFIGALWPIKEQAIKQSRQQLSELIQGDCGPASPGDFPD